MAEQVDVVIVGLGTAGEDLGLRLLDAGLDVVGIDPALVGGECPYWACIPSKMMIRATSMLAEARRVDGYAGHADVATDWTPVARRIREQATGGWDDTVAVSRFEERGGHFVRGRARFDGGDTVVVDGDRFRARRGFVVSTGSRPAIPPIPGLGDVGYWTTHDAVRVESLPRSLTVLGGGAVGCELGQVFARFGVEVSIVEGSERLLPREEPIAGELLAEVLRREGIAVEVGRAVERVARTGNQVTVSLEGGGDIAAQRLLVATGRTVDLDGLGLETTRVDCSSGFVGVDERLRAADGIWAMGDVTGKGMFTHVALYQSAIVAADVLGGDPPPATYHALPRVTFTEPEVGAVGTTEDEARAAGLDVAVVQKQVAGTFRGWVQGPGNEGVIKLVADRGTGVLVGATAVGPHSGEVLSMLTTAVHAELPVATLRHMIYAFPTFHGGVGEALGAYGRGTGTVLDPGEAPLLEP